MSPATLNNQTEIIGRAIDHRGDQLSPEAAAFIVSLDLADEDTARTNELAAKAREGSVNADEEQEVEEYRRSGRLMEMLKLKARMALGQ
jgi:hypothetical protein